MGNKNNDFLSVVSKIGVWDAKWDMIIWSCIGGIIVIISIIALVQKQKPMLKTSGVITKVECLPTLGCKVDVLYTIGEPLNTPLPTPITTPIPTGGKIYNKSVNMSSTKLKVNDNVTIFYDSENPDNFSINTDNSQSNSGVWIFLIIGVLMILFSVGSYMFAKKNKWYAAYQLL